MLDAGRMIWLLHPYYRNVGKRITKSPKVYFVDSGLVSYLTGISTREQLLQGPMAGALFENFCVMETVKSYVGRGLRPTIHFVRTRNGLEVDLVIEENDGALHPVEIKLSSTPRAKMAASLGRFRTAFPDLPVKTGQILCTATASVPLSKTANAVTVDTFLDWLAGLPSGR